MNLKNIRFLTALIISSVAAEAGTLRVAAYNVEFGRSATPEQIGALFKEYDLDIITLNEVPNGKWTQRVGDVLGMKFCFVGKSSSANHKNKYKSILSKTPLTNTGEIQLNGSGWGPSSVVKAQTVVEGKSFSIYSLHIPGSGHIKGVAPNAGTKAHGLAHLLGEDVSDNIITMGDYNSRKEQAPLKAMINAGFLFTWSDLGIDVSRLFTWNALSPTQNSGVIDHILYKFKNKETKATKGGIIELDKALSDHKPVWAEFTFK